MKLIKLTLTILITSLIFVSSCKKYEEGPGLSFRSKKARVENEWKIENATSNGQDITSAFSTVILTFTKEGKYESKVGGVISEKGSWKFDDKKDNIITTEEGTTTPETNEILELRDKRMKLKNVEGVAPNQTTYIYTFVEN